MLCVQASFSALIVMVLQPSSASVHSKLLLQQCCASPHAAACACLCAACCTLPSGLDLASVRSLLVHLWYMMLPRQCSWQTGGLLRIAEVCVATSWVW
jgi:hypothetical protein